MENWKIWLIISSILSIICGLVATFMFFEGIFEQCFLFPDEPCIIDERSYEVWWVIPLASLIGFLIPGAAYVAGKISEVF